MKPSVALFLAALATVSVVPSARTGQDKGKATQCREDQVIATVGDAVITGARLDELAKERLMRLRTEEYQIKKDVLEEYIAQALLEKEARARGISVEQLKRLEIDDRVLPVTDEQKRAVYESNPRQFQGKGEAEAFATIAENLKRLRTAETRNRLLSSLRAKTAVKVLLEPPRLAVDAGEGPSLGPPDARVTVVEFSDFQCPACGHAFPTLKRLAQEYRGKLRLVFRHFPLPSHQLAAKAAEAGACAGEQGKFWEMHDWMFQNQQKLTPSDLKAAAAGLGMDAARFDSCLDSGKHARTWQADLDAGRRYGVRATPTFFVNGRMISGAPPYQALAQILEDELARGSSAEANTR